MSTLLHPFHTVCPSCGTEFPVDPDRVPHDGVNAVCSVCMRTFLVTLPAVDPTVPEPGEPEAPAADVESAVTEVEAPLEEDTPQAEEEARIDEAPAPHSPVLPEADQDETDLSSLVTEATLEEESDDPSADVRGKTLSEGAQRFGRRDPSDRARRLARVLVSDMIAYHPVRYRESLDRGTLKEDFEDEVQRSWEEYVEQVGEELAESTPYFTEALNEILAKGEQIF